MEFMSNVSSGLDESKPSLFELISETQLRDLLEPSVRYVLAIITQRHPRHLIHIFNNFDEAYALLMLLVERHYIRRWGGSFTENFYGIKRERVLAKELPRASKAAPHILASSTKLRRSDIWKSLFIIVCFLSLSLWKGGGKQRAFEAASRTPPRSGSTPLTPTSLLSATALTRLILPPILDSLKILLPTSIFFLKFLEWWHASDFARQLSVKAAASIELPPPAIVPPPSKDQEEEEGDEGYYPRNSSKNSKELERQGRKLIPSPEDSGVCPICLEELTNPTASQTGYVFCYPCIFRWVQDGQEDPAKGHCPITGVKLLGGTEGLRRIMV
ncbi:hypothetical protein C7212DRAFT_295047 [Tuber magnatum]|uniref:Peroxisome assembly protein 12 n=1 Tax=Tuber magnatum TaxID=42249 RepID=A0A317SSZ2_9PEZI|nr:hypothetical protein C7212DRAFT_295047 [Tuber magnatum]